MVVEPYVLPLSGPAAARRDDPRRPGLVFALHAAVVLIALLPLALLQAVPAGAYARLYESPFAHGLLEAFCGITALAIASMLSFLGVRRRDPALVIFALAFLAMGALDVAHAVTSSAKHHETFDLLHTASTVVGALLLFCGAMFMSARSRSAGGARPLVPGPRLLLVAIAILAVGAVYQVALRHFAASGAMSGRFPAPVHRAHDAAAILDALSALAFYAYYCARRRTAALVIGSLLMLFAGAAYLFQFSTMWSATWWLLYGVKGIIYLGILLTIDVGLLLALLAIERSNAELTSANARLRVSEGATRAAYHELRVRNEMIAAAMKSLDLANVQRAIARAAGELAGRVACELVIRVPRDEVDEFNERVRTGATEVIGTPSDMPYAVSSLRSQPPGEASDAGRATHGAFALRADEEVIGQLRVRSTSGRRGECDLGPLGALAAAAGPLVYNALLHDRQRDHEQFHSGILRISLALNAASSLEEILERVYEESVALVRADAAFLWLLPCPAAGVQAGIHCAGFAIEAAAASTPSALAMLLGNAGLQQDGRYRPVALVDDAAGSESMKRWRAAGGFPCGAVAAFPVLREGALAAVLAFVRERPVAFSARTLGKGELLAAVVQSAIHKVCSQTRLVKLNEQLVHAQETRARSERLAALGEMAVSVAHELRNPLGAINNCLGVLRGIDCGADASATAALEIIEDEVRRLDRLARDFLIFGGHKPPTLRPVLVDALLGRIAAAIEHYIAHEKLDAKLATRCFPPDGPILFDSDGLETVLWNLTLNAVQATRGRGQVEITIRVRGTRLLLVVRDNGIGISGEDLGSIFRPFFSRRAHGAGLGLSIVQRYCQDWRAQIRAVSRLGRGTVFLIRIPLPMAARGEPAARRHATVRAP